MSDNLKDLDFKLDGSKLMPSEPPIEDFTKDITADSEQLKVTGEAADIIESTDAADSNTSKASPDAETPNEGNDIQADEIMSSAKGTVIPPENDHADDKLLSQLGKETVVSHYNFINIACLSVLVLAIGLTFLLIRQGERYGEDNAQLTFKSFIDGSYTSQLSRKYINDLKLTDQITDLKKIFSSLYGFSAKEENGKTNDPTKPSQSASVTTLATVPTEITTQSTTTSAVISNNPAVTGVPITMGTNPTQSSENTFTGNLITTTSSLTTSFTTTMSYSHTASKPSVTTAPSKTTTTTTTKPSVTTTPSETTTTSSEIETPPATPPEPSEPAPEETDPPIEAPPTEDNAPPVGEQQ